MSADNYWLVRRHPAGGFSPVMGFASDEGVPAVDPGAPVFATPELALASVAEDWTEYGSSIDPECFREPSGQEEYDRTPALQALLSEAAMSPTVRRARVRRTGTVLRARVRAVPEAAEGAGDAEEPHGSVVARLRSAGNLVRQDPDADPLVRAVGDWLDAEAAMQGTMVEMVDLLNAVVTTQTGREAPIRLGRDADGNPAMHSDTNQHALAVAELIEARYRQPGRDGADRV